MKAGMSLFDTGVRPAIDSWLLREAEKTRDYGDYWSASSAGYCMRKNIFERLGVPHVKKDDDARKQRVFTAGHIFHSWIQGITKKSGLSIAQEVELIDDDLMIKGHFDDLVLVERGTISNEGTERLPAGSVTVPIKRLILYDYKTQNSRAFDYKRPMSHYYKMQLGTYMYMLRNTDLWGIVAFTDKLKAEKAREQITEARILKMDKDTLRMAEEQLLWSPELEKEVVGYWTTLNGYWTKKTIPKCTCDKYENGFLAREAYNPYYYEGEPCSIAWYKQFKEGHEEIK
jgi:hypothetical protein